MTKFLKSHIAEIILFLVVLILAFTNYEDGFFLTGYDNIQTDLNPWLGVKRALWSGWQEYQSFGLPSGMAHASDLVRALLTVALSLILPHHLVRYTLHFLMILLGTLGAFRLIFSVLTKQSNIYPVIAKSGTEPVVSEVEPWQSDNIIAVYSSFLGALFYLLNWGTTQILFFAYDGFTIFFGMLPWLTLSYLSALHASPQNKTRSLLFFTFINILATPSWYSQQLFVVYMLFLGMLTLGMIITNSKSLIPLVRRSFLLVGITLAINSFWILPQMHFLYSNNGITFSAKINQIHTPKTVMENKDKGTFYDFITLNSFYADYVDVQGKHFLGGWLDHRGTVMAKALILLIGLLPLLGFIKKGPYRIPLLLAYVLCAVLLMSNTPLTSHIDSWLRQIPIYNQIFRTPFTKVVNVHALVLSILLAKFVYEFAKNKILFGVIFAICVSAIFFLSWPAFKGSLFSSQVKTPIPSAYIELAQLMSGLDTSSRVALLPDPTFWGWYKHSWGYNGSGFLWYAIEQPFVSRTFDVWSSKSEGYYWELRHAVDTRDVDGLKRVFTKYNIRYVILDETLVSIESRDITKELSFLQDALRSSEYRPIKDIPVEVSDYVAGRIGVIKAYEVSQVKAVNHGKLFVDLPNIEPGEETLASGDKAYEKYGNYLSDPGQKYDVLFPFHDFSTAKEKNSDLYDLIENKSTITISKRTTNTYNDYDMLIPSKYPLFQTSHLVDATGNNIIEKSTRIESVKTLDDRVVAEFITEPVYDLSLQTSIFGSYKKIGKFATDYDPTQNIFHAEASDGANPYWEYILPDISIDSSYIIFINGDFSGPQKPLFTAMRKDGRQIILTGLLYDGKNYFIIPRSEVGSLGMVLSFSFPSYVYMPSSYDLKEIRIHPFPAEDLNSIEFAKSQMDIVSQAKNAEFQVVKPSYYKYIVYINDIEKDSTFVLNQAFDKGWLAYETDNTWFPFFGKRLEDHVLVNNWANAWRIEDSPKSADQTIHEPSTSSSEKAKDELRRRWHDRTYVIVFWPQYLQYLGFGILLITIVTLSIIAWRNRS